MLDIDKKILDIDKTICDNIDLLECTSVTRALISQNLLGQSRNLVEHIAVRAYGDNAEIAADWETIPKAMEFIKHNNKYLFLRKFHGFLQESKSHYTPDHEGAERLMVKYYHYFAEIRNFAKEEYQLEILHNLEKFPQNTDHTIKEFHEKIVKKLNRTRPVIDFSHEERMYVHKVVSFVVDQKVYYEMVLTPVYETTSKFDRFIVYSKFIVPSYYAVKAAIFFDDIVINGKRMPVNIMTDYMVSIRPCELVNYARIFGTRIKMNANSAEYIGVMGYLTTSGASLLDIVLAPEAVYKNIKKKMFARSQVHYFEEILDKSRELILSEEAGANVIRYLLHTLNNRVLKDQRGNEENEHLSDLRLKWGCIPFDKMPFATSLIQHNPDSTELFGSISANGREHEMLARYIHNNMSANARLYTPMKELEEYTTNIEALMRRFNSNIYKKKHKGRMIEKFGQSIYIKESFEDTEFIISRLCDDSQTGYKGYSDISSAFLERLELDQGALVSKEKKSILEEIFLKTHVALIYGAAGTGKTYLINLISQLFHSYSKLYLANTNPAVENLRRNVKSKNCEFSTIRKYVMSKHVQKDFDILILDECSMVSNSDMAEVLERVDYKLLVLVGDTYQIEAIMFGNWFSMAKYFVPGYAWHELSITFRTKDKELLQFWKKVRNLDEDLTEYIVHNRYAANLDTSVFERKSNDEIILCLNYDGLYGINNINRFLQENNPNPGIRWGMWVYKVGDPILFNESERFVPVLYNNLKGTILDIEKEESERIWFTIEVDRILTEQDIMHLDLELLKSKTKGKSVIRFYTDKKKSSDNDNESADDTDIPFQIAYAVSIHKAQGLEYNSVKVIITEEIDNMITHNIFYTAITRSKKFLKIYWSPETQEKILHQFEIANARKDANIFAAQTKMKMRKLRKDL